MQSACTGYTIGIEAHVGRKLQTAYLSCMGKNYSVIAIVWIIAVLCVYVISV